MFTKKVYETEQQILSQLQDIGTKPTLKTLREFIFFIFAVDMVYILQDMDEEMAHSMSDWNVGKNHVGTRVQAEHVTEILI